MSNTFLTASMITNEALAIFENELTFARNINRQYDDSFARSGAKIGDTLNIRKPPRYIGRIGQAVNLEDSVETSVPLTITNQEGVDMYFSDADLALRIDDFSNRFIRPAIATIANRIDYNCLLAATNAVSNSVGTQGAQPTKTTLLAAGALLDKNTAPRGDGLRSIVWGPDGMANMVDSLAGLFNSPSTISEQNTQGTLGKVFGFKNSMDQNSITHVTGPLGGAPLVNGANQVGNQLVVDGFTAAAGPRLNKGDVFTLSGVFMVNPQSRQTTNSLQQFVVTAPVSSDAAGNAIVPIYPPITPTGQFQNVTNSPADNAQVIVRGAANSITSESLAFHRDFFTLAMVDLPLPGGVDMAGRKSDPQTGMSIRFVRDYDVRTDTRISRLDVLYGYAPLYPEWACRIDS